MKTIPCLAIAALLLLPGCASKVRPTAVGEDPSVPVEEVRNDVRNMARETLERLYAKQPSARAAVESAAGYAVFSNFGMKILLAGGGTGRGVAVARDGRETFMRMSEVQAGLGVGIKKFRLIWVFETDEALQSFLRSGYQLTGQATVGAQISGKGLSTTGAFPVAKGVWVYQLTDTGLAAELTAKGTRYYPDKSLN